MERQRTTLQSQDAMDHYLDTANRLNIFHFLKKAMKERYNMCWRKYVSKQILKCSLN
jgi:hypothetical protein